MLISNGDLSRLGAALADKLGAAILLLVLAISAVATVALFYHWYVYGQHNHLLKLVSIIYLAGLLFLLSFFLPLAYSIM